METILFLLSSGRMRAFSRRQDVQQLKYRGADDMPCEDSQALRDFVNYILEEYADGPAQAHLFFCCDTLGAARKAMTLLEEGDYPHYPHYPHYALASLSHCLPLFLRTQQMTDCWVRFEETTWRIAAGLASPAEKASGKCPQEITHRQLAEMFFYEAAVAGSPEPPRQEPPDLNALGRFVDGSKVTPLHSL